MIVLSKYDSSPIPPIRRRMIAGRPTHVNAAASASSVSAIEPNIRHSIKAAVSPSVTKLHWVCIARRLVMPKARVSRCIKAATQRRQQSWMSHR